MLFFVKYLLLFIIIYLFVFCNNISVCFFIFCKKLYFILVALYVEGSDYKNKNLIEFYEVFGYKEVYFVISCL